MQGAFLYKRNAAHLAHGDSAACMVPADIVINPALDSGRLPAYLGVRTDGPAAFLNQKRRETWTEILPRAPANAP
jgi:hypothetical protein